MGCSNPRYFALGAGALTLSLFWGVSRLKRIKSSLHSPQCIQHTPTSTHAHGAPCHPRASSPARRPCHLPTRDLGVHRRVRRAHGCVVADAIVQGGARGSERVSGYASEARRVRGAYRERWESERRATAGSGDATVGGDAFSCHRAFRACVLRSDGRPRRAWWSHVGWRVYLECGDAFKGARDVHGTLAFIMWRHPGHRLLPSQ